MNNSLSQQQNRQVIGALIANHLSKYPHDTGFFISTITEGLNEFANKQRDDASKFLNYLTDVMARNPDMKDGAIYDVGHIAADVIPRWEGAGIHKELVQMFGDKASKYEEELKKEEEKKENQKKYSYGDKNPIAEKFGC
jgi:hypothetical protein